MTYTTTSNRVLIEREPTDVRHVSGIIVPQLEGETNYYGRVVGLGPGVITRRGVLIPIDLVIGDRVMFDPAAALPVRVDGRDLLVVKEQDVVMVVLGVRGKGI